MNLTAATAFVAHEAHHAANKARFGALALLTLPILGAVLERLGLPRPAAVAIVFAALAVMFLRATQPALAAGAIARTRLLLIPLLSRLNPERAMEALSDSVLILGTGRAASFLATEIIGRKPMRSRLAGFIDPAKSGKGWSAAWDVYGSSGLVAHAPIGSLEDMQDLIATDGVSLIVVALEDRRAALPISDLLRARLAGVRVHEAADFLERLTGTGGRITLRPSWLLAAFLLALAAPLMLIVAVLIWLDSPGPVLYRQVRVGEKGRLFPLFKFRTMRRDAEASTGPVWASQNGDPRFTRVGRFLRRTRLDELPQLLNVLRGEMAFVGPRPERPLFVERLREVLPHYVDRHSVKPGMTGWAQIKLSYQSTIDDAKERLQCDLYYIEHMSPLFDLRIIVNTLKALLQLATHGSLHQRAGRELK